MACVGIYLRLSLNTLVYFVRVHYEYYSKLTMRLESRTWLVLVLLVLRSYLRFARILQLNSEARGVRSRV